MTDEHDTTASAGPAGPTPPHIVGGRYRLGEVLGTGASGRVWAARDEVLHREVAVKEVIPPAGLDAVSRVQLRARTMREARAAARITSSAAVTVYDVVDEDERPWIVMERLPSRTLDDVLRERGRLPVGEVAVLGLALLDALDAAHAVGVLHRDVKPGNVMVGGTRIVLTDFGIAQLEGDPSMTSTGMVMGSPSYVAPERAQGAPATPGSDLWSLGATLFAAAEGNPPHVREGILATLAAIVNEDTPTPQHAGPLTPVLTAMLRRDPLQRLDAAGARAELEAVVAGCAPEPTAALPAAADPARPGPAPPDPTPVRSDPALSDPALARPRRWPVVAAALTMVAVAAIVVALLVDGGRTPDPAAGGPTSSSDQPAPSDQPTTSEQPPAPSAPAVPSGYELHQDETGFSVAVPAGWEPERVGGRVYLRDPDSPRYLLVDQTDSPKADPVADWEAQERPVSRKLDNYERISIEAVEYRGYDAADWQFTHGDGTRVLNRAVVTAPDRAYALYFSAPATEWDDVRGTFDVIAETFAPAE